MDFYLCGPETHTQQASTDNSINNHYMPTSVDELSSDDIHKCLDDTNENWIGFVPVSASDCTTHLMDAVNDTTSNDVAAVIALRETTFCLSSLWSRMHPYIACLTCNPFDIGAVAFNTSALSKTSSRNTPRELWDRLLQLATTPDRIQIVDGNSPLTVDDLELPLLAPGRPSNVQSWIISLIDSLKFEELGLTPIDQIELTALEAGLLQFHDALGESHSHSQSIEGQGRYHNGDYWHAIMHRREPDYSNGKYWFRHVGTHPIFDELANYAKNIDSNSLFKRSDWDSFAFVDMCQQAERKQDINLTAIAQQIQYQEMLLLLEHTYELAIG